MKAFSQSAWIAMAAALLAAVAQAHGEDFAVGKKQPTADRIDFTVDLQPLDPFSSANKVGAAREFSRGDVIRLVIHGAPRKGFHTYPLTEQYKDQKGNVSSISYGKNDDLQPLWPIKETPAPESVNEGKDVGFFLEHAKPFTWVQDFFIKRDATPGPHHLTFTLSVQVCDTSCTFGDHKFDVPFTVVDGPPLEPAPGLQERLNVVKAPTVELIEPPPAPPLTRGNADQPKSADVTNPPTAKSVNPATPAPATGGVWDLLGFMWQGILWGALSLVTPCVFPMIPITVSYFLKQSEKSGSPALAGGRAQARKGRSPLLLAAIYSLTIAAVLTVAGVLLVQFVQQFSQHWATNLVLGGLFVFFALSLFGMYDIVLPSWLGRLTAAGEGRGGLVGVVFMALTFTVISFACVAPFYGGFIALSGSGASAADRLKLVLGALAFSVTFALPFFVLALFPSLLKALPKSGSWLNTVKVVMGFLELAAAFKFLRAAEINFFAKTDFLTYQLVLGVYVALAVACGLYLLGVYRLPHDHGAHETLSVPRLLFGCAFLGLALYLLPGLFPFKTADGEPDKPQGTLFAWIDAFLLREDAPPAPAAQKAPGAGPLAWTADLKDALKQADAEKKLLFLDFTAQTCTNCKWNEANVFTDPAVKDLLREYVLVRLYTDVVPPGYRSPTTGEQNQQFQHEVFKNAQLPLYAILRPKEAGGYEVVGRPYAEGKINHLDEFERFLQGPLLAQSADARPVANGE
jgi:thiol:disulfide interchange protein DsbD